MDFGNSDGLKKLQLSLSNPPTDAIEHITVLGNFGVTAQNISTNFQTGGTWYDLMDETGTTTISGATSTINLQPGEFKVYGNKPSTLSVNDNQAENKQLIVYPNPVQNTFGLNKDVSKLNIYSITGKLIKSFKGDFLKGHNFDISDLSKSLYLLETQNLNGEKETVKLVKL